MTPDRDDPLLDACLDEVLGGRTPPDLSARIMQAWAERAASPASPVPPPVVIPPPAIAAQPADRMTAPTNGQPIVAVSRKAVAAPSRGAHRKSPDWQPLLVAAGVLGLGLVVAMAVIANLDGPNVAKSNGTGGETRQPGEPVKRVIVQDDHPRVAPQPKPSLDKPKIVQAPPSTPPTPAPPVSPAPRVATNTTPPHPLPKNPAVDTEQPPKYRDPSPDAEVISFVNATLNQTWAASSVTPSAPATDAEWCRRVYVRVLGRIPTVEELKSFTADRKADKRAKLVDRLLTDEKYVDEYARHWSVVWSNVLIGRTGGSGDSLANREGLEQYLRFSLVKGKPYDQIVRELVTATGSSKPGTEGYNGAVNFLLAGMNKDATLATARVSQVFLGQQLQCAQCHNHPSQDWSQQQFWALNSFFRQIHAEKAGDAAKLTNVSFGGQGQGSTAGEVFYETPAGLLKSAFPAFVDGTAIPATGDLAQVDRRAELARLVTNSDQLPKALVNRMWAHFFGYGFTRPIDDMGPTSANAHPELLDRLADEFAAHHYDLKSVVRWIALSDPFGRSSKIGSLKDMPEAGEVALFSRYYSRQMQAEEVYNSLVQAAQIRKTAANERDIEKARVDWLAQFDRQMGTDDAMEESHFDGSLRQSLIMMNGDLMRHAASTQHDGALRSVMQSKLKFEDKVEHLFLAALSRNPTRPEQQAAGQILKNSGGNEATALEDIWWAVLNSNEFILDH